MWCRYHQLLACLVQNIHVKHIATHKMATSGAQGTFPSASPERFLSETVDLETDCSYSMEISDNQGMFPPAYSAAVVHGGQQQQEQRKSECHTPALKYR